MDKQEIQRDERGRILPGSKLALKHGIYSFLDRGKIPAKSVRRLKKEMKHVKAELERLTPDLDEKKSLIILDIVRLEVCLRLLDKVLIELGPIQITGRKVEMRPILKSYTSFIESKRRNILSLGLEPTEVEKAITVEQIKQEYSK